MAAPAAFAGRPARAQAADVVARAEAHAARHVAPRLRAAFIEKAHLVARDYTEAPVRLRVADRVYEVPANFYSPMGRSAFAKFAVAGGARFEVPDRGTGLGGLHFFWPALGGYTPYNWYGHEDARLIRFNAFSVLPPDQRQPSTAQALRNLQQVGAVEREAGVERHGLRGHRWHGTREFIWVGRRRDGTPFSMRSFDPLDLGTPLPVPSPQCDVRLFDPASREEVACVYPLALFAHWREIDSRCADLIGGWRTA